VYIPDEGFFYLLEMRRVKDMIIPDTPIEQMPKVSRAIVPLLKRLGIHTMYDLLTYVPSRYEDFSNKKKRPARNA
jgi:RecG-like helicase